MQKTWGGIKKVILYIVVVIGIIVIGGFWDAICLGISDIVAKILGDVVFR